MFILTRVTDRTHNEEKADKLCDKMEPNEFVCYIHYYIRANDIPCKRY